MERFPDSLRLVDITHAKEVIDRPAIVAPASSDDPFQKIALLKDNTPDELFGRHGKNAVGKSVLVRITNSKRENLALARPYQYDLFETFSPDNPRPSKTIEIQLNQGSSTIHTGGDQFRLSSEALVNTTGKVVFTIDREQPSYQATIEEYDLEPPSTGEIVSASIPPNSDKNTAIVNKPNGLYKIQLEETATHAGKITVEITNDSHPIRGSVLTYGEGLPSEGDLITTKLKQYTDSVSASHQDVTFEVQLSHQPIGIGEVTLRITEVGSPMKGEVVSYHDLPENGDIITVSVKRQESPATVTPSGERYTIELEERILLDGEIDIQIASIGPPYQGRIDSYRGRLPTEGTNITGELLHLSNDVYVEPMSGSYRVVLDAEPDHEGAVVVQIKESSHERIAGEIVRNIEKKGVQDRNNQSPFKSSTDRKNDLINKDKL